MKFLGHILSSDGIRPDPEKIRAIQERPPPRTAKEVRGFLALCNWFRQYAPHFSEVSGPLHEIKEKGNTPVTLTAEQLAAWEAVKARLSQPPVLRPLDPSRPVVLDTDSSEKYTGGAMLQTDSPRVILSYEGGCGITSIKTISRHIQAFQCFTHIYAPGTLPTYLLHEAPPAI